jgi:UDP-N-acetylmuramyl pentapeptide phosphotransferase/UDP-N-acetylglucosamine-1-phosphate transferase
MPGVAEMVDAAGIERMLVVLAPVSILAGVLTAGLIVLTWPWLKSYALARPNARSSHRQPTPQGGGIAVVVAALAVGWGAVALLPGFAPSESGQFLAVTAAAIGLAFVGAIDDLRTLPAALRLVLQFIAVGAVIAALPNEVRILPVLPWWIERACLLFGGVWLVNLVNFMDGIDWITVAETVPVTGASVLLGVSGAIAPLPALVAAALMGATIGFAPFNRPVARLFLGDVGSLPIGLLLGWLLLQLAGNGHLTAALILPLYYLADATITLARRVAKGEPFWQAHRTHFYQRATDNGFTVPQIVARVFLVNLGLVALALVTVAADRAVVSLLALAASAALVAWLLATFARAKR